VYGLGQEGGLIFTPDRKPGCQENGNLAWPEMPELHALRI